VLGAAIGSAESYDQDVALCLEMGMPPRPAEDFEAVQTSLPALIIEGAMDPVTPPPNARAILPGFENGTYVEFPYAGHGPSRSVECAGSLLNKFYDNPGAEPDLSCVDEMEEPKIWAPMFTTRIAPRLMLMLIEDKKTLALPAVWAGSSILITLIAFLHLTFSAIGRKIDGAQAVAAGGARGYAWLAALFSVATICVLGAAVGITADTSELMLLFGIVPWAKYGAWIGIIAGVLGLITLFATFRTQSKSALPIGTLLGFVLTGGAAVGLSAFLLAWDLAPF